MQNIPIFDIVVISITLLLGLKGLIRGFIKEVFALVGIIGGLFIASRLAGYIGESVAPFLALENVATIKVVGFILGLVIFWALMFLLGIIISKMFEISGLGIFDRVFGFIFGSAKVFLILAIITYALYQVKSFKDLMDTKISQTFVFPLLLKSGDFIIKLDTEELSKSFNKKFGKDEGEVDIEVEGAKPKSMIEEITDTAKEIKKTTVDSGTTIIDTVKKTVTDNVEKAVDKIEDTQLSNGNESIENKNTDTKEGN